MITAKFKGEDLNIPTSWREVKMKDFVKFQKAETNLEKASALLGLDTSELQTITGDGLGSILMAMSFFNEPPNAYLDEAMQIDIGKETYGKIEVAKAHLQSAENGVDALIPILKVYTGQDHSDTFVDDIYPLGAFFLLSCLNSSSVIKD